MPARTKPWITAIPFHNRPTLMEPLVEMALMVKSVPGLLYQGPIHQPYQMSTAEIQEFPTLLKEHMSSDGLFLALALMEKIQLR